MALDRQSIEKKDFPIGRRGYDRDAVDAHLHALADEIEELQRSAHRRTEPLASAASEQVRSIVEAAETTAAEIRRQAADEARESRGELAALIEALRTGSDRLSADVELLEGTLTKLKGALLPRARHEAEPAGAAAPAPDGRANGADDESARLIALNMVMNNTPREEIERYLAEHYQLTDRSGLLDDVYAAFEG